MLVSTATCVYSIIFSGLCVCMCVCAHVCVCTRTGFFCLLNNLQVIRVRGRQPHEFFNSNYLFGLHQSVEGSPPIVSGRNHSLLIVLCTPMQRML